MVKKWIMWKWRYDDKWNCECTVTRNVHLFYIEKCEYAFGFHRTIERGILNEDLWMNHTQPSLLGA